MKNKSNLDWHIILLPFMIVLCLSILIFLYPLKVQATVDIVRNFFINTFGFYYIIVGIFFLSFAIYLSLSKYKNIRLGNLEKPKYSNVSWAILIFTSTMAADILYYSFHEWAYYYNSLPLDFNTLSLSQKQLWASSYPLFHWGPIPWSFYLVLSVAYGYMFYVKNSQNKQKLSEACRPILKGQTDKILGKTIDVLAIIGLLAGTATTFSVATPLISASICEIFNLNPSPMLTITILLIIASAYTLAVLTGIKGIQKLANIAIVSFATLIIIFFLLGNPVYTIETGITGIGNMLQNLLRMSTWMDPARLSYSATDPQFGSGGFPQDWTVFYWAYWIAWCVATPFFIAKISEGRTIGSVIIGGMLAGLSGTFTSFIVFGNFGLFQQVSGRLDVASKISEGLPVSAVIIEIIKQLPCFEFVLVLLAITMVCLYSSTFDAITYVIASYSYKKLSVGTEPSASIKVYWSIVFIILPIALIFSESTAKILQTFSIVGAFPISLIILLIAFSFIKELRNYSGKL